MFTLDQLKHRGRILANTCHLSEEDEKTIDHLLVHYKKARMLWDLFSTIFGTSWVFLVLHTLLSWQEASVGKNEKKKSGWQLPLLILDFMARKEIGWRLRTVLPLLKGQNLSS